MGRGGGGVGGAEPESHIGEIDLQQKATVGGGACCGTRGDTPIPSLSSLRQGQGEENIAKLISREENGGDGAVTCVGDVCREVNCDVLRNGWR